MPPALAAALGPWLIPAILGTAGVTMADANMQNKSAIKNRDNAQASALAQTQTNQQNALNNLGQFNKTNPGPVQGGPAGTSAAPAYSGASIPMQGTPGGGGGATGLQSLMSGGAPGAMGGAAGASAPGAPGGGAMTPQMTPQMIQALLAKIGQGGGMSA